jgi:NAD(P)-dependent dehydrogenase (short-subunit alcohol dehydrogenase family)
MSYSMLGYCNPLREGMFVFAKAVDDYSSMPQAGANVILTARRKKALEGVLEQVKAAYEESSAQAGGKFAAITLDVSKRDEVAALWSKVPNELRNIDILGTVVLPSSYASPLTSYSEQRGLCTWSR